MLAQRLELGYGSLVGLLVIIRKAIRSPELAAGLVTLSSAKNPTIGDMICGDRSKGPPKLMRNGDEEAVQNRQPSYSVGCS